MKLRLGNTIIETDYIEYVQKLTSHSAKIAFTSGEVITVICETIANTHVAEYDSDVDTLLDIIGNAAPQAANTPKTNAEIETLDITGMNMDEILYTVAHQRIAHYQYLYEAATSLGIDIRTLKKHAKNREPSET